MSVACSHCGFRNNVIQTEMSVGEWKRFKHSNEWFTIHLTDEQILHKQVNVCRMAKKLAESELEQYDGSTAEINKTGSTFMNEMIRSYKIRGLQNTILQNKLLIENGEYQIRKIEQSQKELEQEMYDFVKVQQDMGIKQPLYHTKRLSDQSDEENKIIISQYAMGVAKKRKEMILLVAHTKYMIRQFNEEKTMAHAITQIAADVLSNIQDTGGVVLMRREFPKIKSERLQIFSDLITHFQKVYSDISSITTILCADPKFVNMTIQNRQINTSEKMRLIDELAVVVSAMAEQDKFFNPNEYSV